MQHFNPDRFTLQRINYTSSSLPFTVPVDQQTKQSLDEQRINLDLGSKII